MASSMMGQKGFGTVGKPQKIGNTGQNSVVTQQFTPEQMDLFSSMFGNVGPDSYLSKLAGGDENAFNELEAPALKQFSGLQGNLASRFSGQGGTGSRKSSGFQNAMNTSSQDFASKLQSQRMGIQTNAIKQLHSMSKDLLGQRPYKEHFYKDQEEEESGLSKFLKSILPVIGGGVGSLGGPLGSKIGASAGQAVSQLW